METALQNRLASEFARLTSRGVVFDLSDRSLLELTGRDRASFLHNFCTNDIKRLRPGDGCEAFLTNIKGRILEHLFVFADDSSLWVDGTPGTEESVRQHLDRYLITEDVELHPRSAERGLLWVCGAEGADLCQAATGSDVAGLAPLQHQRVVLPSGDPVQIVRFDLAGFPGYQIRGPRAALPALWGALESAGGTRGSEELYDALRIEAGLPRYGRDLTEENLAQEARRTPVAISFKKGCYLGQEPIARIDALGHVNRELSVLEGEGPSESLPVGTTLRDAQGNAVGEMTSVAWHPRTGSPWGLAILKTAVSGEGHRVFAGDQRQPMTVHSPLASAGGPT